MAFYVLCDKNCKYESMTKEQILTAIEQAVNNGNIENVDAGFVTKIKEQNSGTALSFWVGTQAQYNALKGRAENCFYIITDDTTLADINTAIEEQGQSIQAVGEIATAANDKIKKFNNVIYDAAEKGKMLNFVEGKKHTNEILKDYSLFLIDGVLCVRNENTISGCSSSCQMVGDGTQTFTTIRLNIENDCVLYVDDPDNHPAYVATTLNVSTGEITVAKSPNIAKIIGIC